MKKLYLLLVLVLMMLALTACAGTSGTDEAASEEDVETFIRSILDNTDTSDLKTQTVWELDGTEKELGDLIAGNKVTMLNVWGTFCGPCIEEMPYLGELEREYKDQGFEIIGLTSDIVDEQGNIQQNLITEAEEIMADTNVTYPVVIMSNEFIEHIHLYAVPTTIFVDSEGNALGDPMLGSNTKDYWEQIIQEKLAEVQSAAD